MSDVFREVEEDLRQEQLKRLAKRYGPYVAIVIVLVIAVVGGYSIYQNWQQDAREEAGATFASALAEAREGDATAALVALDEEAGSGAGGFRILAAFAAAEIRSENEDPQGAIEGWRALAKDGSAGQPLQDVARLLAVMHAMNDGEPLPALEGELSPLADSDRPLSYLARELTALIVLEQGDEARAKEILSALGEDPESPIGLRGRVNQLLDSLGS